MSDHDLRFYRQLPWTRRIRPRKDSDGSVYWIAWIEEMPALRIDGETRERALSKLDECFDDFVEAHLENDDYLPMPDRWPQSIGVPLDQRARTSENGASEVTEASDAEMEEWSTAERGAALATL